MSNLILKKKDAQWTVEKMENNQKSVNTDYKGRNIGTIAETYVSGTVMLFCGVTI